MDETLAAEYNRNQILDHSLSRYGLGPSHDDEVWLICERDGCNWDTNVHFLDLLEIIHIAIAHNREAHNGQDQAPAQEPR